ncbi:MAG TPA: hypothetical protein VMG37_24375 [Solirubrobacteraceae bacterium]|nr:hypothetical protein [Solirubrobacteraceae bacterium]
MKLLTKGRGTAALIVPVVALAAVATATASASADQATAKTTVHRAIVKGTAGPVTRTFSFIGPRGSKTVNVVSIDGLTINARCGTAGQPVIFGFSSVAKSDILGHVFDGLGRVHIIHNTSFGPNVSVPLSTTSGDYDASGSVLFETPAGKVVTVSYGFDNATTLGNQNVCTVFGSAIAS